MAYSRDYNARINWENFPSTNTAVDADNLNKMDYAIFEHDKKIVELDGKLIAKDEEFNNVKLEAEKQAIASKLYAEESKSYSEQSLSYANQSKSYIDDSKAQADRAYNEAERARLYADTVQEGITTTTSRTLTESSEGGLKINSIDGESQQKQYSGKNYATRESVSVNASSTFDSSIGTIDLKSGDKITVSCKQNGTMTSNTRNTFWYKVGSGSKQYQSTSNNANLSSGTKKWTITATEDATYTIGYWCNTPNVAVEFTEFQIEEGSTMTEYEPFVGNRPSPNPNYPQSIESVEVSEIGTHGKNLQYNSATYEGWEAVSTTFDKVVTNEVYNGGKVLKYTTPWQYVRPPMRKYKAGTYTVSFDAKIDIDGNGTAYMTGLVSGGLIVKGKTFKRYSYTFKITEDKESRLSIVIPANPTYSELYIANIQIEEGVATSYEPYTETKETLSAPITLRGIGDVKDRVVKKDGVYGVLRKFGSVVFNGSESWNKSGSRIGAFYIAPKNIGSGAKLSAEIMCSHALYVELSNYAVGYCSFDTSDNTYSFWFTDENRTLEEFKTWLASNNVEVVYEFATPTFEPLPLADQIALHRLETFGGVTYLFTDSTIEPIIEVEYGTSKVGGYAIKGLNNGEISLLELEQLKTLTNELATQIVAGSEA